MGIINYLRQRPFRTFLLFLFLLIVYLISSYDPNDYQEQIENVASDNASLLIKIDDIEHSLWSPGRLVLKNVTAFNDDKRLGATIEQIIVSLDISQLLREEINVHEVSLKNIQVTAYQDAIERWKAHRESMKEEDLDEEMEDDEESMQMKRVYIGKLSIEDFYLTTDLPGKVLDVEDVDLRITDILLDNGSGFTPENVTLNANLDVQNIRFDNNDFGEVHAQANLNKMLITLYTLTTKGQFADIDLTLKAQLGDETLPITTTLNSANIKLDNLHKLIPNESIKLLGELNAQGDVSLDAKAEDIVSALNAKLNLLSHKIIIDGVDIDSALTGLEDSQNTGLIDIGGYALTGPIGLIGGQLLDLGSGALTTSNGTTVLKGLEAHVTLKDSIISVSDTALATSKHRVSFTGDVSLKAQAFDDFTFNLLDAQGCAKLSQTLDGSWTNPASAVQDTLVKSLVNPLLNLAKKAANVVDDKCTVVYSGVVKDPRT